MNRIAAPVCILFASLFIAFSCSEDIGLKEQPRMLALEVSEINSPRALGRVLFYDKSLSINSSVSCNSCHKQEFAFSDNKRFSPGFENVLSSRNSMPIQNLTGGSIFVQREIEGDMVDSGFGFPLGTEVGSLFWDGRESNLRTMVLEPVVNHKEMGIKSIKSLVERLNRIDYYQQAFEQVYSEATFDELMISDALASFLESITSRNTRFDWYNNGATDALTALELEGMKAFFETYDCNSCHQVQSPNGYQSAGGFSNIGLDPVYEDDGLEGTTGTEEDKGKFKIPSLRNVELTAPYMHDGRFGTLEEVVEHYSIGISDNENLDTRLLASDETPMVLNISDREIDAIVAFLKTLTDRDMVSNPQFSNPFQSY